MSRKVVDLLIKAVKNPNAGFTADDLAADLFTIKMSYELLGKEKKYPDILKLLYPNVMDNDRLPDIVIQLRRTFTAVRVFGSSNFAEFFDFHNSLVQTLVFAQKILIYQDVEDSLISENGIIVFEVIIGENALSPNIYARILTILSELIETIGKIEDEGDEITKLVLLDSGSNTNLAIKTGVETAKTTVQIFKEVLNYFAKRKFLNFEQQNQAIIDSKTARDKIKKAIEKDQSQKRRIRNTCIQ